MSKRNVTLEALDKADAEGNLDCPFCGDTDFDRVGLRGHLLFDCAVFHATPTSNRLMNTRPAEEEAGE